MKTLKNLFSSIKTEEVVGTLQLDIQNIAFDSRKVQTNTLFLATKGTLVDGHGFIAKAIESGASAIVCEVLPLDLNPNITYIKVSDSAEVLGLLSSEFYGNPSHKLKLVGITGTNGKTTCATLLFQLFTSLGYKVGLLSTVENKIGNEIIPSTHTTPDAVRLNELLALMHESGCAYVFMEVSSHAIHQRRIAGLQFEGGVFTNITHDHLDYHNTFAEYIAAKKMFFDELPKTAFALANRDDRNAGVMLQNTKATKYGFSLRTLADYKAKILENSILGLHLEINNQEIYCRLIGEFNAYNALTAYACAMLLGQQNEEVLQALSNLPGAEGRFEYIRQAEKNITAIVDYAHTPDALEKVLETIDALNKGKGRILTVVGCGGDRDKTKRPEMARIAARFSEQVILTSDNPRTENPETILDDMEVGISEEHKSKILRISQRDQAIKTACRLAKQNDFILVAGKGHEKYQEINGVKHDFDDKEVLEKELNSAKSINDDDRERYKRN